jgi:hypothetical protein
MLLKRPKDDFGMNDETILALFADSYYGDNRAKVLA